MNKKTNPPDFIAISSSDKRFMHKLIDWLNAQTVIPDSTLIRVCDGDPVEKAELLEAQIEGMKVRIHDLETVSQSSESDFHKKEVSFYENGDVVGSILDKLIL